MGIMISVIRTINNLPKLKLKNGSIIGSVKLSGSGTGSSSVDHA